VSWPRLLRGAGLLFTAALLAGCFGVRASPSGTLADHLSGMIWPLPLEHAGHVNSAFGPRGTRHHNGIDLRGRHGDPIYASGAGQVSFAGWQRGYGQIVILDHGGGVTTRYAHASALHVRQGERVRRGQVIASVGATGNASGPHLHFEILWAGYPLDPLHLLPRLATR